MQALLGIVAMGRKLFLICDLRNIVEDFEEKG